MSDDNILSFPKPFAEIKTPESGRAFDHPTQGIRFMMEFHIALCAMKAGSAIARREWVDTKIQYLFYAAGYEVRAGDIGADVLMRDVGPDLMMRIKPSIDMLTLFRHTEQWNPTVEDLLARDWYIVSTDQIVPEMT